MATVDESKLCKIINQSGKDIMIALPVGADETNGENAVPIFNKELEILKTTGGQSIIMNGAEDSVLLERNFKPGTDSDHRINDFDLLISDSMWVYPLVNRNVEPQTTNGSSTFQPQTITSDNKVGMAEAVNFYQTISAYQTSKLTKDFMAMLKGVKETALQKADGSPGSMKAVADAISGTVNRFFQGTGSYKNATLDSFVSVHSYYKNFPFAWAQYKDDISYYLYACDGVTATFEGVLSLKKSGPIDASKPNGGYTCQFVPAINRNDTSKTDVDTSKATSLTYDNGVFEPDENANIKFGLGGSFMLKSLFTDKPDDNSILCVMTGNVNGVPCIGFDTPQRSGDRLATSAAVSSNDFANYWDTLLHPKNQYQLLISLLTLAGIILLIPSAAGAIYSIYRLVKFKSQMNETEDRGKVENEWDRVSDDESASCDLVFTKQFGVEGNTVSVQVDFNRLDEFDAMARSDIRLKELQNAFRQQEEGLQKLMEYSSKMDGREIRMTETAFDLLKGATTSMKDAAPAEVEKLIPELCKQFEMVNDINDYLLMQLETFMSREAVEYVDGQIRDSKGVYDQIQDSIRKEKEEKENEDPETSDHIIPGEDF